jgi:hypothetical protein
MQAGPDIHINKKNSNIRIDYENKILAEPLMADGWSAIDKER